MFAAAIFYMDGLLIDSERTIMNTWIDVCAQLGIALAPADYLRIVGRSFSEGQVVLTELVGGADAFRETSQRVRQRLGAPVPQPMFPLKPGARALLAELARAGVPCAVASSSGTAEIRSRLGRVDVLACFAAIAGGDEVARGKPDPAVYRLAAERLGVPAHACLAFEDSDFGAHAATRAGASVVTVPDLKRPTPEVAALSFRILETLEQAVEHVPSWFRTNRPSA